MANIEENHQCASRRERKRRRQDSWPEDTWVCTERQSSSTSDNERHITADKADSMAKDSVSGARGLAERGEEQEIRGRSERWKHKWVAAHNRQQRKHANRDKAIHEHVCGPDKSRGEVQQQPVKP